MILMRVILSCTDSRNVLPVICLFSLAFLKHRNGEEIRRRCLSWVTKFQCFVFMSLISGWQRKISVWCFDLWNLQNDDLGFLYPKWGTFKGPLGPQKLMLLNFCLVSFLFLVFGIFLFFVCYFSLFLFCFLVLVPSLLGCIELASIIAASFSYCQSCDRTSVH